MIARCRPPNSGYCKKQLYCNGRYSLLLTVATFADPVVDGRHCSCLIHDSCLGSTNSLAKGARRYPMLADSCFSNIRSRLQNPVLSVIVVPVSPGGRPYMQHIQVDAFPHHHHHLLTELHTRFFHLQTQPQSIFYLSNRQYDCEHRQHA